MIPLQASTRGQRGDVWLLEPVKKLESAAREQERPYGKAHARAHPRSGL